MLGGHAQEVDVVREKKTSGRKKDGEPSGENEACSGQDQKRTTVSYGGLEQAGVVVRRLFVNPDDSAGRIVGAGFVWVR